MNDVSARIAFRMGKCGESIDCDIRLRMTMANYEKLKAGKPVWPITAICHGLAGLAGYQYGEYVSFSDAVMLPGDFGKPGVIED